MKKDIYRNFFLLFTILLIVFFVVFFYFLYSQSLHKIPPKIDISLYKNGSLTTCGGFCSGQTIYTCAHLFSYFDISNYTYAQLNNCTYFLPPKELFIRKSNSIVEPMYIFADFSNDIAIIFYSDSCKNNISTNLPKKISFVPSLDYKNYLKIPKIANVSLLGKKLFSFNFLAQKGQSGFPILDFNGKVLGMVCSYDKLSNCTYVIPSETILTITKYEIQNRPDFCNRFF